MILPTIIIISTFTIILYFALFYKNPGNNLSLNVKNTQPQPQPQPQPQQQPQQQPQPQPCCPSVYGPQQPYYTSIYGPQRYGANYSNLPDSLYTSTKYENRDFESLNFLPYYERIIEVDNLLHREHMNSVGH
jgi:hypothetical protein